MFHLQRCYEVSGFLLDPHLNYSAASKFQCHLNSLFVLVFVAIWSTDSALRFEYPPQVVAFCCGFFVFLSVTTLECWFSDSPLGASEQRKQREETCEKYSRECSNRAKHIHTHTKKDTSPTGGFLLGVVVMDGRIRSFKNRARLSWALVATAVRIKVRPRRRSDEPLACCWCGWCQVDNAGTWQTGRRTKIDPRCFQAPFSSFHPPSDEHVNGFPARRKTAGRNSALINGPGNTTVPFVSVAPIWLLPAAATKIPTLTENETIEANKSVALEVLTAAFAATDIFTAKMLLPCKGWSHWLCVSEEGVWTLCVCVCCLIILNVTLICYFWCPNPVVKPRLIGTRRKTDWITSRFLLTGWIPSRRRTLKD